MRHILVWAYSNGGIVILAGSQWFSSKEQATAMQTFLDGEKGTATFSSTILVDGT